MEGYNHRPRDVDFHQKLGEARNGFSPRTVCQPKTAFSHMDFKLVIKKQNIQRESLTPPFPA